MIHGYSCSLHEGVDDHRPDEAKPPSHQILADGFRFRRPQRNNSRILVSVHHGLAVHMTPYVRTEGSKFLGHLRKEEEEESTHKWIEMITVVECFICVSDF